MMLITFAQHFTLCSHGTQGAHVSRQDVLVPMCSNHLHWPGSLLQSALSALLLNILHEDWCCAGWWFYNRIMSTSIVCCCEEVGQHHCGENQTLDWWPGSGHVLGDPWKINPKIPMWWYSGEKVLPNKRRWPVCLWTKKTILSIFLFYTQYNPVIDRLSVLGVSFLW